MEERVVVDVVEVAADVVEVAVDVVEVEVDAVEVVVDVVDDTSKRKGSPAITAHTVQTDRLKFST